MRQASNRFFLLPAVFALACAGLHAQANSELTGIISDTTGAVIAGATVTITDEATKLTKTTVSGSTGLYDISGLNPSTYDIKVTNKGFEGYVQNGITINISSTVRIDAKLTVGNTAETVIVTGAEIAVQTDSNVTGNTITTEDISELATENRNFVSLAALGLGVTNSLPDGGSVAAVSSSWAISFNGLSQAHNVWLIDGGESYDRGSGGKSALQPSQDALAEFQVLSSNYPPDYGISTGGTVSMALKSGAAKYHGNLWEENRNTDFDANTFLNKQNTPISSRPVTHFNIYGGNFSGPVVIPGVYGKGKQKTFFFVNEEWRKTESFGGQNNVTIPNADRPVAGTDLAYVSPVFAASAVTLRVPLNISADRLTAAQVATGDATLAAGDAFPNNVIPSALFDSNAVLYLNSGILPHPTSANGKAQVALSLPTNAREDLVRIDHSFNDKWSLMGHWIGESLLSNAPGPFLGWTSYSYNTVTSALNSPSNSAVIKLTGTLNSNLLVEASLNYNGNMLIFQDSDVANKPAGWATNDVTSSYKMEQRTVMPGIGSWGAPYQTSEDTSTSPYSNAARDYEPKLDVSYTSGKHALKFGVSYNRYVKKQVIGGDSQGSFTFGGNLDKVTKVSTTTGDAMMDMLLGYSDSYSDEAATPTFHWYNQTPSAYASDNWHINSRLTLQLGLRYDAMPHTVERSNSMSNFVPDNYRAADAATITGGLITSTGGVQTIGGIPMYMNGMVIAGQNGTPRGLVKNDYSTWQPRIGFSDDLFGNGKTVIRGGFGTFYERMAGNDVFNADSNAPFAANLNLNNTLFTSPATSWDSNNVVSSANLPIFVTGLTSLSETYRAPASAMYSLGVQRELVPSVIWQVQYVGNIDWHQSIDRAINTLSASTATPTLRASSNGDLINNNRTYAGWGGITQEQNTATANYNSLQTGVRIQNKWGLSGEVDYTWAHQIDTTANGSQDMTTAYNPWVAKYDKGSGVLDRRQQLSINYVYKLPFFNKEKGLVHSIAGGWEVAGTVVDNTGLVFISTQGSDTVGLGGGYTVRPNVSGNVHYMRKQGEWFDTAQFSAVNQNADFTAANLGFGNAGKDAIVGPGRINFTTSLYKTFDIVGSAKFKLEIQSFNTFNHTEFQNIDTGLGDGKSFGTVTSTWDPRALQLGGHFTF